MPAISRPPARTSCSVASTSLLGGLGVGLEPAVRRGRQRCLGHPDGLARVGEHDRVGGDGVAACWRAGRSRPAAPAPRAERRRARASARRPPRPVRGRAARRRRRRRSRSAARRRGLRRSGASSPGRPDPRARGHRLEARPGQLLVVLEVEEVAGGEQVGAPRSARRPSVPLALGTPRWTRRCPSGHRVGADPGDRRLQRDGVLAHVEQPHRVHGDVGVARRRAARRRTTRSASGGVSACQAPGLRCSASRTSCRGSAGSGGGLSSSPQVNGPTSMATSHQRISTSACPAARHGAGPSRCSWIVDAAERDARARGRSARCRGRS